MLNHEEIVIRPRQGWIPFDLKELWRFKDLLFFLVWRDIKVRYKQTVLGIAWAVLQPLLTMILLSFVFGRFARVPSDGMPYPLFVYSGLLIWNYFSSTLAATANSLISNSNLITKVYFPRLIIPTGASLSALLDLIISSVFFTAMMFYFHVNPGARLIIMAPLMLALIFMTAAGCGLWLSALNVEYRDFQHVIPFLIQLWMFATPVIYPASVVPDEYRWIFYVNPLCGIIETFRSAAFGFSVVDWSAFTMSVILATAIFVSGLFYFKKVERCFADVI